jgi:hypothetical protein
VDLLKDLRKRGSSMVMSGFSGNLQVKGVIEIRTK